ncbi:MAG: hypothetical protein ACFE9I_11720 [Candidatus Hermodarchaeota archaeon]
MRELYIFDIDGCIMPPIFSNFNRNGSRRTTVKEVIKNGNNVNLYPDFIKFYEKNCIQAESIFFITGRKESEFGTLTESQLKPLISIKNFQIIFYSEKKSYKIQNYFTWKVKKVKEIIKNIIKNRRFNEKSKEKVIINIFDDMNNYFHRIRKYENRYKVQIHTKWIDNNNDWSDEIL